MGEDDVSRFKLAQLWHNVTRETQKSYSHSCVIQEILKDNDFNINYKVTINPEVRLGYRVHLEDCTALHFSYDQVYDISTFTALLEHGADFTIKNANGQTALHLIISNSHNYNAERVDIFLNAVLSAHVKYSNSTNPHDDNGVSHLHGACIANHIEAVELFLDNGASIDETVNIDAPLYAGYTPLHFAVTFCSFKMVKILVERGANVNAQTARGWTPLDLIIGCKSSSQVDVSEREQTIRLLLKKNAGSDVGFSSLQVACTFKDVTEAERLLDEGADIDYAVPKEWAGHSETTALYFAMENSIDAVKMLLKRGAKMNFDSSREFTPFAACMRKYSLQDMCDILSCIENCKEIRLSDGKTRLLDLMSAMENLDKFELFLRNEIENTNVIVPGDSALWPGYTILHLAVVLSKTLGFEQNEYEIQNEKSIVKECLNRGLTMSIQNNRGQTPLHLAFISRKIDIAKLICERLNELDEVSNIVDKDNLSYLHIAIAMHDEALVQKILSTSNLEDLGRRTTRSFYSINEGSTLLHLAAMSESPTIAEMLLEKGADLHATDANGMTPIHRLLGCSTTGLHRTANFFMASLLNNLKDHVVDGLGLSYLHVASFFGKAEIVEKLLDLGSDVNAAINYDEYFKSHVKKTDPMHLRLYSNDTPLQMAIQHLNPNHNVLNVLLRRGADMFVKGTENEYSSYERCPPFKHPHAIRCFFQVLLDREDMQKSMEERLGLTKLHVACFAKNEVAVKSALDEGFDVKAQVPANSELFAGCTPLHMLLAIAEFENRVSFHMAEFTIGGILKMLLDRGADVTTLNARLETPIHLYKKHWSGFLDAHICKDLLLNAHQNFGVNPADSKGMSHFHLACLWHRVDVVEKFLKHGSVNVNKPLDYFASFDAGCSPLHLALSHVEPNNEWTKLSQTVDVLLKHGADVAAKDVDGDTPLHKQAALVSPDMSILDKLVSYGGDIKIQNLHGRTPIEELVIIHRSETRGFDSLAIFQKYGYKINSWNRLTGEGYIAKIFFLWNQQDLRKCTEFEKFLKSSDVRTVDSMGRTAIHNLVAVSKEMDFEKVQNYIYAVESFVKIGIDLEQQDESGQTALHYAVRMENLSGLKALLLCGADINVIDKNGKSAFSYAVEHSNLDINFGFSLDPNITIVLFLHVQKLEHLKIEIRQINLEHLQKLKNFFERPIFRFCPNNSNNLSKNFFSQIELTKTLNIGTNSLTVFDFLSETGVNLYPLLERSTRNIVDQFFQSIDFEKLKELKGIIKMQFKKMTERLELIDSALNSLRTLLGFSIPGFREQISLFLLNSDLKNLIESTAL